MIPFLAPLLGSLAGSLLPASVGTSIAGAVGASGAMGGLVASAAPKAIGAGIGTLIAGGDLGEAAANAAGFGLGGAAVQQGLGGLFGGAGAAAGGVGEPLTAMRQGLGALGQAGQAQEVPEAAMAPPPVMQHTPPEQAHPGGASFFQPAPTPQVPEAALSQAATPFSAPGASPSQLGIASAVPGMGMPSINQMDFGTNTQGAINYLAQRGFA